MLENIRKYSALMTIVIALIAISLIFASSGEMRMRGDEKAVAVNSESYSEKEIQTQFLALPSLVEYTRGSIELMPLNLLLAEYHRDLRAMSSYKSEEDPTYIPAVNQLLINEEAARLGIFVSRSDAEEFLLKKAFADDEGKTDFSSYNNFVDKTLKRVNIKEEDFHKIIINLLTYYKLKEIKSPLELPYSFDTRISDIGIGFGMSRRPRTGNQTIDTSIVQFKVEDFKDKVEATDEEAKAFFEKNKNLPQYATDFRTDRLIKLSYITVNFDKIDSIDDISKNEEDFAKLAELTLKAEEALTKSAANYKQYKKFVADEEFKRDASNLEEIAKKHGYTVQTTELVGPDKMADYLPDYETLKRASIYGTLHNYLFSGNIKKNGSVKVKLPGQVQSSYVYYRIDEVKVPETKTFEQAKESAKSLLTDDLALKAAKKAAEDAKAAIEQAVKEKKDVRALIAEKGWKHFDIPVFSLRSDDVDLQLIRKLFFAARYAEPQSVIDVQTDGKFASVAFVRKREIEKIDGYEALEAQRNRSESYSIATLAFNEWITEKFMNSEIDYPGRPAEEKK